MHMILENFRTFIKQHDDKSLDIDLEQVHLFEGKSKTPTSQQSFNDLLSEYKDNKISEEILLERWYRSTDYEYNELLEEGVADTLKAPVKAFASMDVFVKAKQLARQKVSKYAAKMFAGFAKIMQSIIGKLAAMEAKIFATATSKGKPTEKNSKILKIYQTVIKLVGATAKKIGNIAMSIAKGVFKIFSHPLVKATILVILIGIVILALFKSSIFIGALAGAPAWAMNRLGRKGTIAFYKMIPAAAVAEGRISLNEIDDVEEWAALAQDMVDFSGMDISNAEIGMAIKSIASDIEVGTEVDSEVFTLAYANIDGVEARDAMEAGADAGEALAAASDEGYFAFVKQADEALSTDLMAIRQLQMALESAEGVEELQKTISVAGEADSLLTETIKTAILVAKKTCVEDPSMCEASEVLAQEFETFNVTSVKAIVQNDSRALLQNGVVAEEWQKMYSMTHGFSKNIVTDNPFADAGKAVARGDYSGPIAGAEKAHNVASVVGGEIGGKKL